MKTMQGSSIKNITRSIILIAFIALMAGCNQSETTTDSAENQAIDEQSAEDQQPLGHVVEVDGFTLRANVSRADLLSDDMARKYGIEAKPDLFLLNLVIQENRPDQQPVAVSAEVSAKHEGLTGHGSTIDMRAIEENGYVSYIGTVDASDQRIFELIIEAQPEGTDQSLHMNFEVQLEEFEDSNSN